MEQLHFLGTGAAMNARCFTTAILLEDREGLFLLDSGGGNGLLMRLDEAGIDPRRLTDVFISHTHTDHILGVPWLMRLSGHHKERDASWPPLTIYGNSEVIAAIRTIVAPILPASILRMIGDHIRLETVNDGDVRNVSGREVTFFDIGATKVRQFGIYTPLADGSGLAYLGDEPLREAALRYARRASHMICEGFCTEGDIQGLFHPHQIGHSTVADAAKNARDAGVQHLILFHSTLPGGPARKAAYLAEASRYFDGQIDVPDDLDIVPLRGESHALS